MWDWLHVTARAAARKTWYERNFLVASCRKPTLVHELVTTVLRTYPVQLSSVDAQSLTSSCRACLSADKPILAAAQRNAFTPLPCIRSLAIPR